MGEIGLAAVSSVSATTGSTTLLAANAGRNAAYIFNDSTTTLNIKFGATATSVSFTNQLAAGAFYAFPDSPVYTGLVTGIWAAGTGSARVTEL